VRKSDNFDMSDKAYTLNLFCNVCQFLHGSTDYHSQRNQMIVVQ